MPCPLAAWVVFLVTLLSVEAQDAGTATCDPSSQWAFNSQDQSPCTIAERLGAACNAGQYQVPPLGVGQFYSGPSKEAANECRCSSVFYSMLSECASCQNRTFLRWSAYNGNCTTVYSGVFNKPLPVSTPAYAFQNVTASDGFNVSLAFTQVNSGAAESPAAGAAQSTEGAAVTSLPLPSAVSSDSTSTSKKSNAGAIAGGVVGGVVFLLLTAGIVYWVLRQHRRRASATSYGTQSFANTDVPPMSASSSTAFNIMNSPRTFDNSIYASPRTTTTAIHTSPEPHMSMDSPSISHSQMNRPHNAAEEPEI